MLLNPTTTRVCSSDPKALVCSQEGVIICCSLTIPGSNSLRLTAAVFHLSTFFHLFFFPVFSFFPSIPVIALGAWALIRINMDRSHNHTGYWWERKKSLAKWVTFKDIYILFKKMKNLTNEERSNKFPIKHKRYCVCTKTFFSWVLLKFIQH